jgi:hypothetical protein
MALFIRTRKIKYHTHSRHGIRVTKTGNEIASALVLGSAGATGIDDSSYVVSDETNIDML